MIRRPYQEQSIESLRGHLRDGKHRIVLAAPTGSGKSIMIVGANITGSASNAPP